MPTRLVRANNLANIADFGAQSGASGFAATNALAFRNALASGAKRIVIPPGDWWFEQVVFGGNNWWPAELEIYGDGRQTTFLHYAPTNDSIPAFQLAPGTSPLSRTLLHDFQLIGRVSPSLGVAAVGVGIQLSTSHLNVIRDVEIWNFAVGIDFPAGFSGYNAIERFELNGCTTGIRMRDGSNGVLIQSGRILGSLSQIGTGAPPTSPPYTSESGVGIDIEGTVGAGGPAGGSGIVISAVQIEATPLCLRIVGSHDIAVQGCYLEPGNRPTPNTLTGTRRTIEIDAASERIAIIGTLQSEPTVSDPADPIPTQDQTPNYVGQVPEARGVADPDSFRPTGIALYSNIAKGAARHGATAAHANRIRNGDMSRGVLFWTRSAGLPAGNVTEVTGASDYVVGGRSLQVTSTAASGEHIYQEFTIDAGVRSITAMVRYRVVAAATAAFRFDLATVDALNVVTQLGFYADTDAVSTAWRVRSLTARFEGTLTGVQGPRRFRVRIYPFFADAGATVGRQIVVDSVWLVDGEYATPYRPYQEGVEILSGDDRVVLFSGTNANAPSGPSGIPAGVRVPANAVAMVTEMLILGTNASATTTTLVVDDNTGTDDTRTLHAFVSNRPSIVEYTVPLVPGGTNVQWSMAGASGANLVTYSVRVKAWIYRL